MALVWFLLFLDGQERRHELCQFRYGYGLEIDLAGAGDDGVKEALAAEEHILRALINSTQGFVPRHQSFRPWDQELLFQVSVPSAATLKLKTRKLTPSLVSQR